METSTFFLHKLPKTKLNKKYMAPDPISIGKQLNNDYTIHALY